MSFEHMSMSTGMAIFFLLALIMICVCARFKAWHDRNYLYVPARRVDPSYSSGMFMVDVRNSEFQGRQ